MCVPVQRQIPVQRYRLTDLYQLKSSVHSPPPHTITRMKELGIFHYRGGRGGSRIPRRIPIIMTERSQRRKHQKERRGGGVVVYCRSDLLPSHLNVNVPEGLEVLWVRVTPTSHPRQLASLIVCVVYHPPRSPTADVLVTHL
ncbi:hypothetical protein Pmani_005072 [Petrolisthes manimaculis]|uniref:Uncharacterized protein n=1 Tax=Petrolisthes manimaculis TaxID=1843537 RepID=A0AAE1QFA3_9EUCA|nr:hypothetical protein Pmani_005072 [Petrolisthes manimaculis]